MPEGCPYYDLFLVESAYYFFVKICKAACDSLFHILTVFKHLFSIVSQQILNCEAFSRHCEISLISVASNHHQHCERVTLCSTLYNIYIQCP